MGASLKADARRLEMLMPSAMRVLHRLDPTDELTHLSVPQLRMLRILNGAPHATSAVGELLGLSVSAVTQMVNRLEAAGLVARADTDADRRVRMLSLTNQGREIMEKRRQHRIIQAELALSKLPDAARQHLISTLELLVAQAPCGENECKLTVVAELEQRLPPLAESKS